MFFSLNVLFLSTPERILRVGRETCFSQDCMTETVFAYFLLRFPLGVKNPNMYSPIVAFEFSECEDEMVL